MTGLIFVRFSRPIARVVFSRSMVIAPLNGKSTLMVRVGNENHHSMVEAKFRIMYSYDKQLAEGGDFRYFHDLKLHFDQITVFPAALTLRHEIDETSPLHGKTIESLEARRARLLGTSRGKVGSRQRLSANQDEDSRGKGENSHDNSWQRYRRDERHQADQDQINC